MLDASQIEEFHHNGFLVVREVIAGRELVLLQEAAAAVVASGMARSGQGHHYVRQSVHLRGDVVERRVGERVEDLVYYKTSHLGERDLIFQAVAANPDILTIVAQCMGHPFLPINDSLVCKLPGTNVVVPWHRDIPYEDNSWLIPEIPDFDVDIFLDPTDKMSGTLWILPRHHLVGRISAITKDCRALFDHPDVVAITMQPGDLLLHALTSPHASLGNFGNEMRRVLYLHYMAEETFLRSKRRWADQLGGFSIEMIHTFLQMVAARESFGLINDYERSVRLTAEGLAPVSAWTAPRHWRGLRHQLQAENCVDKFLGHEPNSTFAAG